MAITPLVLRAVDITFAGIQIAVEWYDERAKKKKALEKWAKTPIVVRGCPQCNEVAYAPGQLYCTKCGVKL